MTTMVTLAKVAWIRDQSVPMGQPAAGRLNCRCGGAPVSNFNKAQGHVTCACGTVYTWDGYTFPGIAKGAASGPAAVRECPACTSLDIEITEQGQGACDWCGHEWEASA